MSVESWRFSRAELRRLLDNYEKSVEEDVYHILRPTDAERKILGNDLLQKRAECVRAARDANRKFVEAMVEDLPDLCDGPDADIPSRPICEFRDLSSGAISHTNTYGSLASVNLHLLRDWSLTCDHVCVSTYEPAVAELKEFLPSCRGEVLLPGAGLGRLALAFAREGFTVEANDASRLFLTVADYLLNRPPASATIYPVAHAFSENWSLKEQYMEIEVPKPLPADALAGKISGQTSPKFVMVPGDFNKLYGRGCIGQRKFDAIVTCFFIDTSTDPVELFQILDGLLDIGGIWLNVGPLNWRKESRLKLTYEEIVVIWESMGYEFVSKKKIDADYHLPRGFKMYTESYQGALTVAIKRRAVG
jgi:hypothetical protein